MNSSDVNTAHRRGDVDDTHFVSSIVPHQNPERIAGVAYSNIRAVRRLVKEFNLCPVVVTAGRLRDANLDIGQTKRRAILDWVHGRRRNPLSQQQ